MNKAMPRPWERGRGQAASYITSVGDGQQPTRRVAELYYGTLTPAERSANAALIVRAVNSHDALVAACEDSIRAIDIAFGDGPMPDVLECAYLRAKAALAKAKE